MTGEYYKTQRNGLTNVIANHKAGLCVRVKQSSTVIARNLTRESAKAFRSNLFCLTNNFSRQIASLLRLNPSLWLAMTVGSLVSFYQPNLESLK